MWCKRKVQKTALFPGGPTGFILAKVAFAECEPRCLRCCAFLALGPCAFLAFGQIEGRPLSEDVRQDGDEIVVLIMEMMSIKSSDHDYHHGDYRS